MGRLRWHWLSRLGQSRVVWIFQDGESFSAIGASTSGGRVSASTSFGWWVGSDGTLLPTR